MATHDDGPPTHPTGQTRPAGCDPADAHATDATEQARKQKPADAPRSAAEEAEREQARQLAEGTESPG
jgi:hypothetical protein